MASRLYMHRPTSIFTQGGLNFRLLEWRSSHILCMRGLNIRGFNRTPPAYGPVYVHVFFMSLLLRAHVHVRELDQYAYLHAVEFNMYTHTHACMHTHTLTLMHLCTHTHSHTHICMHSCTQACIYTYGPLSVSVLLFPLYFDPSLWPPPQTWPTLWPFSSSARSSSL